MKNSTFKSININEDRALPADKMDLPPEYLQFSCRLHEGENFIPIPRVFYDYWGKWDWESYEEFTLCDPYDNLTMVGLTSEDDEPGFIYGVRKLRYLYKYHGSMVINFEYLDLQQFQIRLYEENMVEFNYMDRVHTIMDDNWMKWSVTVTDNHFNESNLELPARFVLNNLSRDQHTITLIDDWDNNYECSLTWDDEGIKCGIAGQWADLLQDQLLTVGDKITFQFDGVPSELLYEIHENM